MCGIAGFYSPRQAINAIKASEIAKSMADAIWRRGPDGHGVWCDAEVGIALSHRRLSIIDLSEAGAQPMQSKSTRFVISYNGEIYNHYAIRQELDAAIGPIPWRGTSDTEIVLAAIEHWGVEISLRKMRGMFAFALWDNHERRLTLARDRLGEKPLYYGFHAGTFLFGSELKALQAFEGVNFEINQGAVASFLKFGYVPTDMSIYDGIYKLPPASFLTIDATMDDGTLTSYWSIEEQSLNGKSEPFTGDVKDTTDQIEGVLTEAVKAQLISDVPLGVFLSGGIDSSLITALMAKLAPGKVKSFSIGFEDTEFNEAIYAREIAQHLGTEHQDFTLTEQDALETIPKLATAYDEPFADASQIPTMLLSQKTREHVTVALSGDGGDEIFGGYNRYIYAPSLWKKVKYLPKVMRKSIAGSTTALQGYLHSHNTGAATNVVQKLGLPKTTLRRFSKFGDAIANADSFNQFLNNIISFWPDHSGITHDFETLSASDFNKIAPRLTLAERMMIFDAKTYLPDDILVKVDRSAMYHSLETRAPFLDPNVVNAAARLPIHLKINGKSGKHILKDILHRHVPAKLFDRPKQGFSMPLDDWLRKDLKDWAGDNLSAENLARYPFINARIVERAFSDHISGKDNNGEKLWPLLMLMDWTHSYHSGKM